METPQKRLNAFILKVFGKKNKFTEYLGVHPSWTTSYTGNGKSEIKDMDILEKLSIKGLDIEWYKKGIGEMLIETSGNKIENITSNAMQTSNFGGYKVKFVNVLANAGISYNFDDIPKAELLVSKEYPDTVKAFIISGDSMNPDLSNGDTVFADSALETRNNDIVMAVVDGLLVCKRLVIEDEHKYSLIRTTENDNFILNSLDDNIKLYKRLEAEGYIKLKQKLNPAPVYLENNIVICNYSVSITSFGYDFISKYEELLCSDI